MHSSEGRASPLHMQQRRHHMIAHGLKLSGSFKTVTHFLQVVIYWLTDWLVDWLIDSLIEKAVWPLGSADTVCPRPSVTLTFDRLTLKLVCESHLRWETFILFMGTLGLWVFQLFAMYVTDGQTDTRTDKSNAYCSLPYGRGIIRVTNSACCACYEVLLNCIATTFHFTWLADQWVYGQRSQSLRLTSLMTSTFIYQPTLVIHSTFCSMR